MSDSWQNPHLVDTLMAYHQQQPPYGYTCTCTHHLRRRRSSNLHCTTPQTSSTTTTTSSKRAAVLRLHSYPWWWRCSKLYTAFTLLLILSCLWTSVTCKPVRSVQQKMDNPCSINMGSVSPTDQPLDTKSAEAKRFYRQIVLQTGKSMAFNDELIERYVHAFEEKNFRSLFSEQSYEWLPKLPPATDENIGKATIEDTLKNFFAHLQHYAFALEHVLDDQVRFEGDFIQDVADIQGQLRLLRCELHTAILKLGVSRLPDVSSDVISKELKSFETALQRNVRDYIILRDYNKAVHYLKKFFEKQS